ncbi:hypothetical protein BC833DRAFT_619589 [Globomyces pollinis-pini]|nr:hypothetical protein BC833DRAFT_619589 [Globomyces pollinis-pini]
MADCPILISVLSSLGVSVEGLSVTNCCSWDPSHIECENNQVIHIQYMNAALTGVIPPAIGKLKSLRRLYLSFNKLSGTLPMTLGDLSFKVLLVNKNKLSGTIPPNIKIDPVAALVNFRDSGLVGPVPNNFPLDTMYSNTNAVPLCSFNEGFCYDGKPMKYCAGLQFSTCKGKTFDSTASSATDLVPIPNSSSNSDSSRSLAQTAMYAGGGFILLAFLCSVFLRSYFNNRRHSGGVQYTFEEPRTRGERTFKVLNVPDYKYTPTRESRARLARISNYSLAPPVPQTFPQSPASPSSPTPNSFLMKQDFLATKRSSDLSTVIAQAPLGLSITNPDLKSNGSNSTIGSRIQQSNSRSNLNTNERNLQNSNSRSNLNTNNETNNSNTTQNRNQNTTPRAQPTNTIETTQKSSPQNTHNKYNPKHKSILQQEIKPDTISENSLKAAPTTSTNPSTLNGIISAYQEQPSLSITKTSVTINSYKPRESTISVTPSCSISVAGLVDLHSRPTIKEYQNPAVNRALGDRKSKLPSNIYHVETFDDRATEIETIHVVKSRAGTYSPEQMAELVRLANDLMQEQPK